MTCMSDRSGMASSGMLRRAKIPASVSAMRCEQNDELVPQREIDDRPKHRSLMLMFRRTCRWQRCWHSTTFWRRNKRHAANRTFARMVIFDAHMVGHRTCVSCWTDIFLRSRFAVRHRRRLRWNVRILRLRRCLSRRPGRDRLEHLLNRFSKLAFRVEHELPRCHNPFALP